MAFKPDYGMSMIGCGYKTGMRITWTELRAYNVDRVDDVTYCTTLEIENIHAGRRMCCMTIDMDQERLVELLRLADPEVANDVVRRLNSGQRSIDLEHAIPFMLEGELGAPRLGRSEEFAPIIARRILASTPRP